MRSLLQILARLVGVFLIFFVIFIATENGNKSLMKNIGINLKNSAFRTMLNINDSISEEEDASITAKSERPIYGLLDVGSFTFISLLLLGIMLSSFDFYQFLSLIKNIMRSPDKLNAQIVDLSGRLKEMSQNFYAGRLKEGVNLKKVPPVWPLLIEHLDAKMPFTDVVRLIRNEAISVKRYFNLQISIVNMISNISPSLGVLGTVLGLVKMLQNMKDPSSLGPNMSLALLTTFYGLFFSVVIFKSIVTRLQNLKEMQMKSYQIAAFWLGILADRRPGNLFDYDYRNNKKTSKK